MFFYTPDTLDIILTKCGFIKYKIIRKQTYGLINHINWLINERPSNLKLDIPILDNIYKWILCNILKISDTMLVIIDIE
jgi:hypothetical protein